VGPRAGLDDVEKRKFFILPGLELRPLARSQSLHRLNYRGSRLSGYGRHITKTYSLRFILILSLRLSLFPKDFAFLAKFLYGFVLFPARKSVHLIPHEAPRLSFCFIQSLLC
jgi:hypothetical protein